ncbi:MAG: DUF2752 domain-containing protein [Planctomycetota bacterium]
MNDGNVFLTVEHRRLRIHTLTMALAIVGVWGALILAIQLLDRARGTTTTVCMFKRFTGVECPTCGSTRATVALARGDVVDAFLWNPLIMVIMLGATIWLVLSVGFARTVRLDMPRRHRWIVPLVTIALVLINWSYVLWFRPL